MSGIKKKIKADKKRSGIKAKFVPKPPEDPAVIAARWEKKKDRIHQLAHNISRLRLNVTKDLESDNERTALIALIIALMDRTGERIGNNESIKDGHYGVTYFKKSHAYVVGGQITLDYVGKSGVPHNPIFNNDKIAIALKRAMKNSPSKYIFETSEGLKIHQSMVNEYLHEYSVTGKDIRGYFINRAMTEKLKSIQIPETEKERKKLFTKTCKQIASKIGHGAGTCKKHYIVPELPEQYITHGKIIDLKSQNYYKEGGKIKSEKSSKTLLASNGKQSNLSPEQYKLVRTPKFISWFGDWINDSENASKIVDENGEPLVVYHGTCHKITEFDERYGGETTANNEYGAFYFTDKYQVAEDYARQCFIRQNDTGEKDQQQLEDEADRNINVIQVFLNIRHPLIEDYKFSILDTEKTQRQVNFVKNKIDEDFEFSEDYLTIDPQIIEDYRDEIIKRAMENNSLSNKSKITTNMFEEAKQEIFDENGILPELENLDGIIIKNVQDDIGYSSQIWQTEYIAIYPEQIKLADGTNKEFNPNNPDIRYSNGGIPDRYKSMGFSRVGQKKKSTRPQKKWMVLAKKGDQYKVVHGGQKGMKDFSQHHDKDRQKRFWNRMGGWESAKASDPFSPLYWHKRFGTWEKGGVLEDGTIKVVWVDTKEPETLESKMFDSIDDALKYAEGKTFLIMELEEQDDDYYKWHLLPYGEHKRYKGIINLINTLEEGGVVKNNDFANSNKSHIFIPTKITKDELQSIISGIGKVANGDLIQATLIYLRGKESPSSVTKGAKPEGEEERLTEFIDKNNLWYNGQLNANKYVDRGSEQIVYEDPNDKDFVLKTNNLSNYSSWSDYLINLLLNNTFFPATSYELIGFKNEQGKILPVVKQYYVTEAIIADLKEVQKYLFNRGFRRVHPLVNAYRNWDLGIMLGDLHDRNVLFKDNTPFFIDTKFFISPDAEYVYNKGGDVKGISIIQRRELEYKKMKEEGNIHDFSESDKFKPINFNKNEARKDIERIGKTSNGIIVHTAPDTIRGSERSSQRHEWNYARIANNVEGNETNSGGGLIPPEAQKQIDEYIKEGIFITREDKPVVGLLPISRFNGPNANTFPNQQYVYSRGVAKWKIKIREGARPYILIDHVGFLNEDRVKDGHHRLKAYEELGFTEIPVIDVNGKILNPSKIDNGGILKKQKLIFYHGVKNPNDVAQILKYGFDLSKIKPLWNNDYAISVVKTPEAVKEFFGQKDIPILKLEFEGVIVTRDDLGRVYADNPQAYTREVVGQGIDAVSLSGGFQQAFIYNPKAIKKISLLQHGEKREYGGPTTEDIRQNFSHGGGVWWNLDDKKIPITKLPIYDLKDTPYLYHVTSPKNRTNILKHGITIGNSKNWNESKGDEWVKYKNMIFATVTDDQEEWFSFTGKEDVWRIDLSKIKNKWHDDPFTTNDLNVVTDRDIPASAINLYYDGIKSKPLMELGGSIRERERRFKEGGYIYHGTGKGQARSIQRDGFIRPSNTGEKQPSISFTDDLDYAKYYANAKGGGDRSVILRTKLDNNFKLSPRIKNNKGAEYITFNSVPSSKLEINTHSGWHPLDKWNVIFDEPL